MNISKALLTKSVKKEENITFLLKISVKDVLNIYTFNINYTLVTLNNYKNNYNDLQFYNIIVSWLDKTLTDDYYEHADTTIFNIRTVYNIISNSDRVKTKLVWNNQLM